MMSDKLKFLLCVVCFFVLVDRVSAGQIAVIVHHSVQTDSLDKARLVDIYTLNSGLWDDKAKIHVVDIKGEPDIKKKFYKAMDVSLRDMRRIWLRKLLSGKAIPPKAFKTQEEVVREVASAPGLIGYVDAANVTAEVRVIYTINDD
jgi:ABC-type phosphate transport system substrate-binding protein